MKYINEMKIDDSLILEINELYGINLSYEECGYNTIGHTIICAQEKKELLELDADPLYGEILIDGLLTLGSEKCLNLSNAKVLYDLGMGCGKLLLFIFNLFTNITRLEGFEISKSRYLVAVNAFKKYYKLQLIKEEENIAEFETFNGGSIKLWCKSFTDLTREQVIDVDRLFVNVHFKNPLIMKPLFDNVNDGCKIMSYMNFAKYFSCMEKINFDKLIKTSWTAKRVGHKFYYFNNKNTRL